jgi:hypothetical protein
MKDLLPPAPKGKTADKDSSDDEEEGFSDDSSDDEDEKKYTKGLLDFH